MYGKFEALKNFAIDLERFFYDPQIREFRADLKPAKTKREEERQLKKFEKIAPRVIARMSATNVPEVE